MRHRNGETITVTRAGTDTGEYDDQGYPIPSAPTTFTIADVAIEPTGTLEDPQAMGLWVVTGFNLYLPYGSALEPTDVVSVRGIDGWGVTGSTDASGWRNPFTGKEAGVVVGVKRAS